jgi:hypothetical protein
LQASERPHCVRIYLVLGSYCKARNGVSKCCQKVEQPTTAVLRVEILETSCLPARTPCKFCNSVAIGKGAERTHQEQHRRVASAQTREQPRTSESNLARCRRTRHSQHTGAAQRNSQSRKGVSAPGNTCCSAALASNSEQERYLQP